MTSDSWFWVSIVLILAIATVAYRAVDAFVEITRVKHGIPPEDGQDDTEEGEDE